MQHLILNLSQRVHCQVHIKRPFVCYRLISSESCCKMYLEAVRPRAVILKRLRPFDGLVVVPCNGGPSDRPQVPEDPNVEANNQRMPLSNPSMPSLRWGSSMTFTVCSSTLNHTIPGPGWWWGTTLSCSPGFKDLCCKVL